MAKAQEAPYWFTHTFNPLPEDGFGNEKAPLHTCNGVQTPHANIIAKIAGYNYQQDLDSPEEQFVVVDLSGGANGNSGVDPTKLAYNRPDKVGGFTDRVEVQIWFSDEPRLRVAKSGPDTTSSSGSVSSSESYSLSGGLFGGTGTGTAGWSISTGFAKSISDFAIENLTIGTGNKIAKHVYSLRMVDGSEYYGPPDVVAGSWTGSMLHLPERATSDLPISSFALFHSPERIDKTCTLHIRLVHRLITVEKSRMVGPVYNPATPAVPRGEMWDVTRPWFKNCTTGTMEILSTPTLIPREWYFFVDLKDGAVKEVMGSEHPPS